MFPSDNWLPLLSILAFTDSTQKDLVKLIGNLPVQYGGKSELWHQRLQLCYFVTCTDDSISIIRPLLQLPCSAVAAGLIPLHPSHMPSETNC